MKIVIFNQAHHVGETLARAAKMRGFKLADNFGDESDLIFVTCDVEDHAHLGDAKATFDAISYGATAPVVHVSQVPPGTTRAWAGSRKGVFYQADTIIMDRALARAYAPEQFIIGCVDPAAPLPLAYQEYLMAHDCPILRVSYESAEMAKCAINYMLAKQIEAANELAAACEKVGASYEDVRQALHNDARIGKRAYLRPGKPNQHLSRDVDTINRLIAARLALPVVPRNCVVSPDDSVIRFTP